VLINGATSLADRYRITDALFGMLVLAIGTDLPEVSVSFAALLRKRSGLSVSNLLGSNVLDTLLVPGIAAVISPLNVPSAVRVSVHFRSAAPSDVCASSKRQAVISVTGFCQSERIDSPIQ